LSKNVSGVITGWDAGLEPACVMACPTGAIMFGDMNDPESTIAEALAKNAVQVIKAELGTNPKTFYIGLDQEVVDIKEVEQE